MSVKFGKKRSLYDVIRTLVEKIVTLSVLENFIDFDAKSVVLGVILVI